MQCPKCAATMEQVVVGDDTVDRCTGCGGMWFDHVEYEHVAASSKAVDRVDPAGAKASPELNDRRDISCPRCNQKMIRMAVPGQAHIQFERCGVCHGSFFDAGEIRDLSELTLAERVRNLLANFRK